MPIIKATKNGVEDELKYMHTQKHSNLIKKAKREPQELKQRANNATTNAFVTTLPGVVACTCNPGTLETEFRNSVGSIPVGGKIPLIGGWIV